ncbi:VCBS domain-containing protein [Pseudoalteromonas sp. MMG010]|uniref:VCBS domain-containing protein n=1 Tax=Pseudoalteromonas sp. MMG010 TaxID=2822685 RepID=UPI001B3A3849|nr:VCBS domain-containing protein [Pseudoalteromonas sp. MMG010]MBQ4831690.1 VCBS domain-containing protein [Pseudoalteromonas sp. MMG010]
MLKNSDKSYRIFILSALCYSLLGCGSSGSAEDEQGLSITIVQTPAVIAGDIFGSLLSDSNVAITGMLTIEDDQTAEAVFQQQVNNPTDFGFFDLDQQGNWSYLIDLTNTQVVALEDDELLTDVVTVISADGTTALVTIEIKGVSKQQTGAFILSAETTLNADGADIGLDAYTLIENVFSSGAIESPDMYEGNHEDVVHIIEDFDQEIGNHFVFLAHRDIDQDKDNGVTDRQRNEIKAYDKSPDDTLAYEGDSFQFSWKFKVSSELALSSKFSHFFQLKARNDNEDNSNGNDAQPIITLSGAEKNSTGNQLQVRYSAGFDENGDSTGLDKNLAEVDWSLITDEWVEVFVQATFAEQGQFYMTLTRLSDDTKVINISESNIDMWRGVQAQDFVRPKWGIYRSIVETDSLREEEEQVRFANFSIKKGMLAQ